MTRGVLALVLVLAACGPKPARVVEPAGTGTGTGTGTGSGVMVETKDPLATAVERIVTLYESIATLPPGSACRDAAASIDRWTEERAAALAQVRTAAQSEQAALVDGLFHDASPRLAAAMKAIDELTTRCAAEPALADALTRLSTEAGR